MKCGPRIEPGLTGSGLGPFQLYLALRVETGLGNSGSEGWYQVGLGFRQTRVSGSEVLHKKSILRSHRVSGLTKNQARAWPYVVRAQL